MKYYGYLLASCIALIGIVISVFGPILRDAYEPDTYKDNIKMLASMSFLVNTVRTSREMLTGIWWVALAVALVPLPVGWLLGWPLISTGRWIRSGFKP